MTGESVVEIFKSIAVVASWQKLKIVVFLIQNSIMSISVELLLLLT